MYGIGHDEDPHRVFEALFNIGKHGKVQDGSNMTGTDWCVNKPHRAAAVRP